MISYTVIVGDTVTKVVIRLSTDRGLHEEIREDEYSYWHRWHPHDRETLSLAH